RARGPEGNDGRRQCSRDVHRSHGLAPGKRTSDSSALSCSFEQGDGSGEEKTALEEQSLLERGGCWIVGITACRSGRAQVLRSLANCSGERQLVRFSLSGFVRISRSRWGRQLCGQGLSKQLGLPHRLRVPPPNCEADSPVREVD